MLGHRPLDVDDYLAILKRRRWLLLIPTVLLPIIAVAVTFFIPAQYVSQTLVLIDQQKVPDDYVKPVLSSDLDSRLASMREQILSRSRIQPIVERYNLYPGNGSMDDRIDLARKAISIKPIHSEIAHANGLPGFFIAFIASDARTAQLACGEITSLFTSEDLRSREASAQGTTDFLKGQLDDAKRGLDDQDAKLAAFQRQYIGKLPGEETPNVNMLTSLNTQLEASTQSLAQMEQNRSYVEAMLTQQVQTAQNLAASYAGTTPQAQPLSTPAQEAELQQLLAQEADLTSRYTADYPDVISVRRKIAELRRRLADPAPIAPVATASGSKVPAASTRESVGVQQLRAQLKAIDVGIQAKRAEQAQIQSNVRMYQDRIQSSPLVEAQYKELTRDYETAQKFYDNLLAKMNDSKMATDLERRQQGEQFRVMDAPNLPDSPTFPKRGVFGGAGLAAGLFLGLALAAFFEYKDTAMRTERDVMAFTRLPTLAVLAFSDKVSVENSKVEHPPSNEKRGRLATAFAFLRRRPARPVHDHV